MIVILCEKPSVARDIAKAFQQVKPQEGYYLCAEGSKKYAITWAYGHLFEIDEKILPEKWILSDLPIFPEEFKYVLIEGKNIKKQFQVIKSLLSKASEVIIATDAGEEGELIARLILIQAGWKNWESTYRLWTSEALTPQVVRRELQNGLKKASAYNSLFYASLSRQHADFIVGINLTRAATLKARSNGRYNNQEENRRSLVWSIGRVQTPTLALIVERTLEIENFKPEPYWIIKAIFSKDEKTFEAKLLADFIRNKEKSKEKKDNEKENKEKFGRYGISDEKKVKEIYEKLKGENFGLVTDVKIREVKEPPPLLHSLTSLQREANKLYNFTAEKTLQIAQNLYEVYKCISYPRSDAQYLATSSIPLVKNVLRKLGRSDLVSEVDKVGKRVFDDSKLTDHHAIIPLDILPSNAKEDEKKIYNLIVRRFFGVFMPDYRYEVIEVWIDLGGYIFYARGRRDIELGWRSLYKNEFREEEENGLKEEDDVVLLPELKKGDIVFKEKLFYEKKMTEPPLYYTEGTLLKKMENLNLGTPATRHLIIETLKTRKYITVVKKSLIATEKGKTLIAILKKLGSRLLSAELTGYWEKKRREIYKENLGVNGYKNFMEEVKKLVVEEIEKIKNSNF